MSEELLPLTSLNPSSVGSVINAPSVIGQPAYNILVNAVSQITIVPQTTNTVITLGSPSTQNDIFLNGGIRYNVTTKADSATSYTISDNDYMVIFTSPTYNEIIVPSSVSRSGKSFIIIRRFGGTSGLKIKTSSGDTFDGYQFMDLYENGCKLQIISDGISGWNTF